MCAILLPKYNVVASGYVGTRLGLNLKCWSYSYPPIYTGWRARDGVIIGVIIAIRIILSYSSEPHSQV